MAENKCCCNNKIDEGRMKKLEEIINEHKTQDGALIPILHEAQELFGYLPEEVQQKIADGLGISLAEVYGVATFYSRFTLIPKGRYKYHKRTNTTDLDKEGVKMLHNEIRPTKKPDCDNIAKICLDALNGLAYVDDSQVVCLSVSKMYAKEPKVVISLFEKEITLVGEEIPY